MQLECKIRCFLSQSALYMLIGKNGAVDTLSVSVYFYNTSYNGTRALNKQLKRYTFETRS